MSTHTARPAAAPETPFYVWEVPGQVSIQLHFDVIDRILPEVMRGFGALPRRGAEVGGLLIGRVLQQSPLLVSIEDYEPIPCEYLTGPSYRMSARDLQKLEESLEQWHDRPLSVVGWFRSHTRKDLFLDEHDWQLIQRYFSHPNQVVLAVKPFATRSSIGGFFYWDDGQMRLDAPHSQFPFNRRELGGGDPMKPESTAVPRHAEHQAPPPVPKPPAPPPAPKPVAPPPAPLTELRTEPPPRPRLHVTLQPANIGISDDTTMVLRSPDIEPRAATAPPRFESAATRYEVAPPEPPPPPPPPPASLELPELPNPVSKAYGESLDAGDIGRQPVLLPAQPALRYLAIAVALLAIVGGTLIYRALSGPPEVPAPASALPLRLSIQQMGRQMDVTWDRESPSIQAAKRGVLEIEDGATRQQLALTAAQLRNGLVRYTRVTDQVNLKLEVFATETSSVTESTRVVAPGTEPVQAPLEVSQTPAATQPRPPVTPPAAREPGPESANANPSASTSYNNTITKDREPPVSVEVTAEAPQRSRKGERRSSRGSSRRRSVPAPAPVEESEPVTTTPVQPASAITTDTPRDVARPPRRR
jgi:hypothetical protein